MTKFLTKEDLFEKDEKGFYLMDGETVGFIVNNRAYAGKLTISNRAIYLNQTRIGGGAQSPDNKGMKMCWVVEADQVSDYYVFKDPEVVSALVDVDRDVIEYYRMAEKAMAEFDKRSIYVARDIIKESLDNKRSIAETAFKMASKAAENAVTIEGMDSECLELQTATDERCDKSLESWNK